MVKFWDPLAEVYRSRLKSPQSAVAAYEVAMKLDPTSVKRREKLAELYLVIGDDQADKAVVQHQELLKLDPYRYDSYKALRRIYMDTDQFDKAWCLCNTLNLLNKANEEEKQYFEQYKPRGFVKAKQRMTDEMWKHVYHEKENLYIDSVFGTIWQGPAMMKAQPHKSFKLKRKDRRVLETDQLQFSKIFYYASQVSNAAFQPDVYLLENQEGAVSFLNVHEKGVLCPSLLVGKHMLSGRRETEIAYVAGKWLTLLRPDHILRVILETNTELRAAFWSALTLVNPKFPVPAKDQANVANYAKQMSKRMKPQWVEQLGVVVQRIMKNSPKLDLNEWSQAVDQTAYRMGFILSGDLQVAYQMVGAEPVAVGAAKPKEKLQELILYSISEDYFKVRKHLGLTIG